MPTININRLNVWAVIRHAPPLPFLPEEVHGKEVVVLAIFHVGEIAEGQRLIEPLHRFGDAHGEHIGPQPYTQWQQAFDGLLTPGARNYWKSHNFTELADGVLDSMIEYSGKLPTPQSEILLGLLSGVSNDVPADATAYGPRDAKFVLNVHGRDLSPKWSFDGKICPVVLEAGFVDYEITWRDDVFKGAPQQSSADQFGTLGINFRARKPSKQVSSGRAEGFMIGHTLKRPGHSF